MNGGIRPGILLAAASVLVAALAILRLAAAGDGGESTWQPARAVSLDRSGASSAVGSIREHPAAALLPSPSQQPPPERHAAQGSPAAGPLPVLRADALERSAPSDSRAAADLRILEEEAARRFESQGLTGAAALGASAAPDPGASGDDDASRTALADAVLVEHAMQQAYRGTEFPIGFPAEERTREAAESWVRSLTPALRQAMLKVALATAGEPRVGPRLDPSQIWEGVLSTP